MTTPLNGLPGAKTFPTTITDASSSADETSSTIPSVIHPALSNTRITSSSKLSIYPHFKTVTHTSTSTRTLSSTSIITPQPSCTTLSITPDGSVPMTIGLATLASPPNWPFSYASNNATFDVTFGQQTTPGSLGYAELNPSTPATDSILYYQLNSTSTLSTTSICQTWGYLYHQPSGLCLTALQNTVNPTGSWLYESANLALEPCIICDVAPGLPESDQLFCAVQEDGTLGKWFCMGFMGDDVQGLGYGLLYQEGVVDAVLEKGGGDCIYVAVL
jgi:hypothetical protein